MAEGAPPSLPQTRNPPDEATLRGRLTDEDTWTRQQAALACARAARDQDLSWDLLDEIERRAREDPVPEVRQFSIEALGHANRGTSTVEEALDDPDSWVRAEAVLALSQLPGPPWARIEAALEDPDGWVRRNAVEVLGEHGRLEPGTLYGLAREDEHAPVREAAIGRIGSLDTDPDVPVAILADVLACDPNAFARANAARVLGSIGTDQALAALQQHGVDDRSDDVRRAAEVAVSRAKGTGAGPGQVIQLETTPGQPEPAGCSGPVPSSCGGCPIQPGSDGCPAPSRDVLERP